MPLALWCRWFDIGVRMEYPTVLIPCSQQGGNVKKMPLALVQMAWSQWVATAKGENCCGKYRKHIINYMWLYKDYMWLYNDYMWLYKDWCQTKTLGAWLCVCKLRKSKNEPQDAAELSNRWPGFDQWSWPLQYQEFTTAVLKVDRANYLKLILLAPALMLFVRCAYSHIWIVDNQLFLFFVICFGPFVSIYKVIFWMSKSFLVASQNWVIHNLPPKTPLKCVTPESKTLGVWYI